MTAHGSFEALCPSRGASRDHTTRECHRRGSAELGEQLLVSISEDDVSDGAIRQRAVIQGFSWGHWLRAPRHLLIHGRASASYILMPRLPAVLKGVPNTKFPKWCVAVAKTARVASPRPYGATDDTCSTVKMTQLPDAFGEQSLPTVLLSHAQHEAVIREGDVSRWV